MAVAVLIGFEYTPHTIDSSVYRYQTLPGAIIDLYRMYNLVMGADFDYIIVVTDIIGRI